MSDKGGSDLDVFENLSKAPVPARKNTLVALPVPPNPAPASNSRGSLPPPPPPSLRSSGRLSAPPPPPDELLDAATALDDDEDEAEEVDAVEEASSPLAAPVPYGAPEVFGSAADVLNSKDPFADDETRVFDTLGSSPEASPLADTTQEPPTPYMPRSSAFSAPAPPPPPPTNRSSLPVPPPPTPSRPSITSLPPPPPPLGSSRVASSGPPPPSASTATDWEDEDDKTSVFNRESGFDAAHMLMGHVPAPRAGLPDAPPPPMSRPSAPIPSAPVVAMPTRASLRVESSSPASVPPVSSQRTPLLLGLIAAVVLGVALFFLLRPTTGGLVVTVAGPGNKPLNSVQVLVGGKVACSTSPCSLKDLPAGTHMVRARAEGYQEDAETAVLVSGGQDAVHNIRLARAAGSGVRVTSLSGGLRLYVDDKDIGPLPQDLKELTPGQHRLKVVGDAFEPWERTVTVNDDELLSVEVPKLKVLKGLAVIKAGENAEGAKVVLDSGGDRRALPTLPISLHIDTSKVNKLIATKRGFDSFEQELVFEDGNPEQTFEISLQDGSSAPSPGVTPRGRVGGSSGTPRDTGGETETASGSGTLNINSIPASNVIVDGRPVGTTPKVGVSVSAGRHTVVFMLDGKRASKSVTVGAGKSATVVHRFK